MYLVLQAQPQYQLSHKFPSWMDSSPSEPIWILEPVESPSLIGLDWIIPIWVLTVRTHSLIRHGFIIRPVAKVSTTMILLQDSRLAMNLDYFYKMSLTSGCIPSGIARVLLLLIPLIIPPQRWWVRCLLKRVAVSYIMHMVRFCSRSRSKAITFNGATSVHDGLLLITMISIQNKQAGIGMPNPYYKAQGHFCLVPNLSLWLVSHKFCSPFVPPGSFSPNPYLQDHLTTSLNNADPLVKVHLGLLGLISLKHLLALSHHYVEFLAMLQIIATYFWLCTITIGEVMNIGILCAIPLLWLSLIIASTSGCSTLYYLDPIIPDEALSKPPISPHLHRRHAQHTCRAYKKY